MTVEPRQDGGIDLLAVDVDAHAVPAAREGLTAYLAAAHQPALDLGSVGGVDGAVASTMEHEHRCADRRQLIAHVVEKADEFLDRPHGTQTVRVKLVDGSEVVQIDVVTRPVPAHDTPGHRDDPPHRAGEPHGSRQGGHRGDPQIGGGEVQRDRPSHRLPGQHHLVAVVRQGVELRLRRRDPIVPVGRLECLRGCPVPGERRSAAAMAVGREVLAKAPQLGRCAGEAVDEKDAAPALAERPRSDHLRVERCQGARGHGRPSIWPARGCYRRGQVSDELMRGALERIVGGESLDVPTARAVMDMVMDGSATSAQIGGLLAALRTRGETLDELTGMVMSMRDHATPVELEPGAVDTCGTGGDGSNTFNISTASAVVAAAAGCRVAKHGNRAASSRCGSADVLEELGVRVVLDAAGVRRCVDEAGIGFIFAPAFHPAMRHAAAARRELGIRTVFNVLGPLANPARVRHQALGVAGNAPVAVMAAVLQRLGHRHALVFSGPDGMDEIGLDAVTHGYEVTESGVRGIEIDPQALGLRAAPRRALTGGDAATNAAAILSVLDGTAGPPRDVVLLNAAAAMVAADVAVDMAEGIERGGAAVDSGAARQTLSRLIAVSQATA